MEFNDSVFNNEETYILLIEYLLDVLFIIEEFFRLHEMIHFSVIFYLFFFLG